MTVSAAFLPATRVQFGLGAVRPPATLRVAMRAGNIPNTPSLRVAGSDDEDENEAPGETGLAK